MVKEFDKAFSPTGKMIVFVDRLQEEFHRRDDGSVSAIKQDTRFDNHSKMTTSGIVVVGTDDGGVEVFADSDLKMPRSKHVPTPILFSGIFKPSINKGDRVFFNYLCSENKAYIEPEASGGFYINMNTSDVYCSLPGDDKTRELLWNMNFCAGKEIIQDERNTTIFDQHGTAIRAKIKPSQGVQLGGIAIAQILNAKPMVNECIMWGIGPAQHHNVFGEVKNGDHVYLSVNSEDQNYILDQKVWIFKHTDIVGIVKPHLQDTIAVGMYHLVKVSLTDYRQETQKTLVHDDLTGFDATLLHKAPVIITPNKGKIIRSGKQCVKAKGGDHILFTKRFCRMLDKGYWLVHDSEIQMRIS